jgi:hypothetical protein
MEPPRNTIHTIQQRVTVGNKTMTITEYHTKWNITIYIGSPTIYCIDITISKDIGYTYHSRGILNNIRWDGECQFADPFEQGTDTFMMIHVIMTYLHRFYPAIKELTYTDLSSKEYEQRTVLGLCALKLFTEGPSWYETRIPMRMDPSFDDTYRIIMDRTDRQKRGMPWKEFIFCTGYHPTILGIDRIQETYESCQTWQEFFRYIRSQLDTDTLIACLSSESWFDEFILKRMQFQVRGVQFLFNPSSYDIEYTLEPMEGGKAVRPSKGVQRWRHTLRRGR